MISVSAGGALTVGSASGGTTIGYNNISTSPVVILPLDAQRRSITFHNPGSVLIFVAQTVLQNTGSDALYVPSLSNLGGSFLVPANGGVLIIDGECQKPWQAFSAAGLGNPLTIKVSHT